jgi:hypothetical protein
MYRRLHQLALVCNRDLPHRVMHSNSADVGVCDWPVNEVVTALVQAVPGLAGEGVRFLGTVVICAAHEDLGWEPMEQATADAIARTLTMLGLRLRRSGAAADG